MSAWRGRVKGTQDTVHKTQGRWHAACTCNYVSYVKFEFQLYNCASAIRESELLLSKTTCSKVFFKGAVGATDRLRVQAVVLVRNVQARRVDFGARTERNVRYEVADDVKDGSIFVDGSSCCGLQLGCHVLSRVHRNVIAEDEAQRSLNRVLWSRWLWWRRRRHRNHHCWSRSRRRRNWRCWRDHRDLRRNERHWRCHVGVLHLRGVRHCGNWRAASGITPNHGAVAWACTHDVEGTSGRSAQDRSRCRAACRRHRGHAVGANRVLLCYIAANAGGQRRGTLRGQWTRWKGSSIQLRSSGGRRRRHHCWHRGQRTLWSLSERRGADRRWYS